MKIYSSLQKIGLSIAISLSFGIINTVKAQVSAYTFSQSVGTYSNLSNPTTLGIATGNTAATNLNSNVYNVALPFAFNYNGVNYNDVNVFDNGFITLGSSVPPGTTVSPLSSNFGFDGAISIFGRDLTSFYDITGRTGQVSYEITGTAPNRQATIEWRDFRPNYSIATTLVYSFSFQIILEEGTGIIKMIYNSGGYLVGSNSISGSAQIGLRGLSFNDFNNRSTLTTQLFNSSTIGTSNSATQFYSTVTSTPGMPEAGLCYTWTPPTCFAPTGINSTSISSNSISLAWNIPNSNPSGYDIYYSTSNTNPTSTTTPSLQNIQGNTTSIPSLNPLTRYYIWIRSNCGGNTSEWIPEPLNVTTTCLPLSILSTTGATACNNTALLSATADTGADINWYDSATGGTLLSTGATFTTPIINTTTDYWVSASTGTANIPTGKTNYSPSPTSGAGTTNFGILFNALDTFTLQQVTIYPVSSTSATGTVTIDLIDQAGNLLNTKTINVTGAPTSSPTPTTVDLNFIVFPGTNYKLRLGGMTGITGLLFDPAANAVSGNQGFPFSINNLITINSSTLTAAPTNTPRLDLYYYFYNWKVSTKCESSRVMVTANAGTGCLATNEIEKNKPITLYPNPFTDTINISQNEFIKSIQLIDLNGKLIKKIYYPYSSLNLSSLPSSTYFLLFEMKDGTFQTHKIIKK